MKKPGLNWDEMVGALTAFRKARGHCNVPAEFKANPRLGRWVAAQRFRRKVGELPSSEITLLDKLGFVWSAMDLKWNGMFERLVAFKKKHGHCDVSYSRPETAVLASWVSRQRNRNKNRILSADRIHRLNSIGFKWAANAEGDEPAHISAPKEKAISPVEERLYCVGAGAYLQYNGHGVLPPELHMHARRNDGELPAFIPLPKGAVKFTVGNGRKVEWAGQGPIPQEVLDHVNENGSLPIH